MRSRKNDDGDGLHRFELRTTGNPESVAAADYSPRTGVSTFSARFVLIRFALGGDLTA
jgi:hypothetical protein